MNQYLFKTEPRLKSTSIYKCTFRCIIINSFSFLIVVFDEDATKEYIDTLKNFILTSSSGFVELDRHKQVKLKKDKNFGIDSLLSTALLKDNCLKKREPLKDNLKNILC